MHIKNMAAAGIAILLLGMCFSKSDANHTHVVGIVVCPDFGCAVGCECIRGSCTNIVFETKLGVVREQIVTGGIIECYCEFKDISSCANFESDFDRTQLCPRTYMNCGIYAVGHPSPPSPPTDDDSDDDDDSATDDVGLLVFLLIFGLFFLFLALYDTCWWMINYRYAGVIYPKREKSAKKIWKLVVCRAILYVFYAILPIMLFLFGAKLGLENSLYGAVCAACGLVLFIVMNCAKVPVDTEWRIWPTAIVDIAWGAVLLFGSAMTARLVADQSGITV